MKKVAVIMSTWRQDSPALLQRSIQSILDQVGVELDLFICVDGPVSDELSSVLDRASLNPRVYIEPLESNRGLAHALNHLIDVVLKSGPYQFVARMDSDDYSYPDRLARQVEAIEARKLDVIGTDVVEIDRHTGKHIRKSMPSCHQDIIECATRTCPMNHPTVLFRSEVLASGARYDENVGANEDYKLWLDLLAGGKRFGNLNEPLLEFTVSADFYNRRGVAKALDEIRVRFHGMKILDDWSMQNIVYAVMVFCIRLAPTPIKKLAYRHRAGAKLSKQ
jgi:glycosyltransferase involved in cell wall biosynthesis